MVLDHQAHSFTVVRRYVSFLSYPLYCVVDAPWSLAKKLGGYFTGHQSLIKENQELKQTELMQAARLQILETVETENARLQQLLQAYSQENMTFKLANILQVDADPFYHHVLIDKGSNVGIKVGQPILDRMGIMGEVVEVYPFNSRVALLTDASHAIPVENLRNGVRGIVVGSGAIDRLSLQYVPTTADIQAGDKLVSSGLGGRYPHGYPVGVVVEVKHLGSESFAKILVKPIAELERGHHVLLIDRQPDPEISEKEGS